MVKAVILLTSLLRIAYGEFTNVYSLSSRAKLVSNMTLDLPENFSLTLDFLVSRFDTDGKAIFLKLRDQEPSLLFKLVVGIKFDVSDGIPVFSLCATINDKEILSKYHDALFKDTWNRLVITFGWRKKSLGM